MNTALSLRKSVRQAALDAAMALAHEEGPAQLTLDAVAARAGVSKGGLLHHFNTKEALLTAMVGEVIQGFDRHVRETATGHAPAEQAQAQLSLAEAHIRSSFDGAGRQSRSGMALLSVAALQPALIAPVREYMQARTAALVQAAPRPAEALAAMLMADAMYLFDALGSPMVGGALREQVGAVALRLLAPQAPAAEPVAAPAQAMPRTA